MIWRSSQASHRLRMSTVATTTQVLPLFVRCSAAVIEHLIFVFHRQESKDSKGSKEEKKERLLVIATFEGGFDGLPDHRQHELKMEESDALFKQNSLRLACR